MKTLKNYRRPLKLTKIFHDDGSYFETIRVETKLKEAKRLKKFVKNKKAQQQIIDDLKFALSLTNYKRIPINYNW